MAFPIKGSALVDADIVAGVRFREGTNSETITATKTLIISDKAWQILSAAATQDVVLPDATTLNIGTAYAWHVRVYASGASALNVKYDDGTTLLRTVNPGEAVTFTCYDGGTTNGLWAVSSLIADSSSLILDKYEETFNATTDWGAASGGFYTITVAASTHLKGLNPTWKLFEVDGSTYTETHADKEWFDNTNGNVSIRTLETPDTRFAGSLWIF
jgi:hypothetical protein